MGEKHGVTLHHAIYRVSKELAPDVVSDLHIQARVKAREAIQSALAPRKKGRTVSCPRAVRCPPRYNPLTYRLNWEKGVVNLATVAGPTHIPFRVPNCTTTYAGTTTATADLVQKRGR